MVAPLRPCAFSTFLTAHHHPSCTAFNVNALVHHHSNDWARDGAIINKALEAAGFLQAAAAHNRFYARVQRNNGPFAGTLAMNFWADGVVGGPIPLEIDEAAMACWSMATHAFAQPPGEQRQTYALAVWPAVRRAAHFLTRWRDPVTKLPLPANEDDHIKPTEGVQATVSAFAALGAAAALANSTALPQHVVNTTETTAWLTRQAELRAAALKLFRSPVTGAIGLAPNKYYSVRGASWVLWPGQMLPAGDKRLVPHADALWNETRAVFDGDAGLFQYDAERVLALTHARSWMANASAPRAATLRAALHTLVTALPTPGTQHYGEHYLRNVPNGPVEQLNDMPHCWEHALVYLAAMQLYPPNESQAAHAG